MDSSSSPNTPLPNPSANEEGEDEEDEDILVQFDFEASMKAKNSLTVANSSASNLTKSVTLTNLKSQGVEEVPSETDKERLEAIKTKKENQSTTAFDMFAEDDEYETVSERESFYFGVSNF